MALASSQRISCPVSVSSKDSARSLSTKSTAERKRPLKTFKKFPLLPTELSLKIWHLSFPVGNSIDLDFIKYFNRWDTRHNRIPAPPTTLFINAVSRRETLDHYWVIRDLDPYRYIHLGKKILPTIIYVNPKIDRIIITEERAQGSYEADHWIDTINIRAPGLLRAIERLEVRGAHWTYHERRMLCLQRLNDTPRDRHCRLYNGRATRKQLQYLRYGRLFQFTELKELAFELGRWGCKAEDVPMALVPGASAQPNIRPGGKEELERKFTRFLNFHKKLFSSGEAPKVTMQSFDGPKPDLLDRVQYMKSRIRVRQLELKKKAWTALANMLS